MHRLRYVSQLIAQFALVAFIGNHVAALAMAQTGAAASAPKSYATAYLLTGLCIGLGLIAVLRPTNRAKPE